MEYSLAKGYISRRRFWKDFKEIIFAIFSTFAILSLLSILCFDIKNRFQKVIIVRDTIYIKQQSEVQVKGPQGYKDFFNEKHPLDLTTSDGIYHFKVIDP